MKKINKAVLVFTLIFIASLGLARSINADVINTLNISIQNPPKPPAPPKKPEPPLPPAVPTTTPRATPLPSSIPGSDVCANIDGVQTSVPDGMHLDATGLNCVNWNQSGSGSGNGGGAAGSVLGSSTMAGTGSFTENLYMAIMGLGGIITFRGVKNLKKAFKVAK